jgi:hypothetical protein
MYRLQKTDWKGGGDRREGKPTRSCMMLIFSSLLFCFLQHFIQASTVVFHIISHSRHFPGLASSLLILSAIFPPKHKVNIVLEYITIYYCVSSIYRLTMKFYTCANVRYLIVSESPYTVLLFKYGHVGHVGAERRAATQHEHVLQLQSGHFLLHFVLH